MNEIAGRNPKRYWIVLLTIVATGAVLRFASLGVSDVWLDEAMSYRFASLGAFVSLRASLDALAPGGFQAPYLGLEAGPWSIAARGLMIGLLALAVWALWHTRNDPQRAQLGVWAGTATVLPLTAGLATSEWLTPVYLPGRIGQLIAPTAYLLAAFGALAIPSHVASLCATPAVDGDSSLARAVAASIERGDAILTTGLSRAPLEYALREQSDEVIWRSFPASTADHLGNYAPGDQHSHPAQRREAATIFDQLTADPRWQGRVWLVLQPDPTNNLLLQALLPNPRPRQDHKIGSFVQTRLGLPTEVFFMRYH